MTNMAGLMSATDFVEGKIAVPHMTELESGYPDRVSCSTGNGKFSACDLNSGVIGVEIAISLIPVR